LKKIIYTIGTSDRKLEEFITLLQTFEIEIVADIRRFPTSKFEHFKKENLDNTLKEKKMDYVYLGRELGGYRKEGYPEYMKTNLFKEGINRLATLSGIKRVVFFVLRTLSLEMSQAVCKSLSGRKEFQSYSYY